MPLELVPRHRFDCQLQPPPTETALPLAGRCSVTEAAAEKAQQTAAGGRRGSRSASSDEAPRFLKAVDRDRMFEGIF
ncbi:hypothetical protein EYF80_040901 [Liparis tanakae]|uniref:Uncharacterized protein n=1 Tax=Liparis tanakae TaxID=230148 RepID=A0A4Z2G5N6_9TELE|nr:hypothetical protein EYF80_040901 [Liparis tanakae]